jgi:hypothetical protein
MSGDSGQLLDFRTRPREKIDCECQKKSGGREKISRGSLPVALTH